MTKSPPFTRSVPLLRFLHWLLVKLRIEFKISLLTDKTLHGNSVYFHSMFAPVLPSRSLRSNKGITVCQSLGPRPMQVQEHFILVPVPFGTTSRCLSIQPRQLQLSGSVSRHISWTWPFPIDTSRPDGPWCYGTTWSILLLNTDSAVAPLSLALPGILVL